MALPSTTDLRNKFPVATQTPDSFVESAISDAAEDIQDAIGIDAYREIFEGVTSTVEDDESDADTTTTNENARRTSRVTRALFNKAFAYVIRLVNTRQRSSGSVIREQDASSPAMSGGKQVDNQYMTPEQVDALVAPYESKANELLQPYLLSEEINTFIECELIRG